MHTLMYVYALKMTSIWVFCLVHHTSVSASFPNFTSIMISSIQSCNKVKM